MRRILFRLATVAIMYLGCTLPHTSSDSFVRSNWFPTNTILHVDRILAVASGVFPYRLILSSRFGRLSPTEFEGRTLSPLGLSVTVRIPEITSVGVTHYPSPSILLYTDVSGLSSGASAPATAYCRETIIPRTLKYAIYVLGCPREQLLSIRCSSNRGRTGRHDGCGQSC